MTRVSSPAKTEDTRTNGIRPVNLRTDLAQLADLIEIAFADSMDSGGRAALREMRTLSRMGPGMGILSRMNDVAMGMNLGYVWILNGNLIGNVSVYPARWPKDLGDVWIIANVGVHPDFQRRGIARKLMQSSMEMIAQRGGTAAILQVDADNEAAHRLYRGLGFVDERVWTLWRRSGLSRVSQPLPDTTAYMRHRRRHEWREEFALARRIRPQHLGGLGWLHPLHVREFRQPFWQSWIDLLGFRSIEQMVIRSEDDEQIAASLRIENVFGGKTRFRLLVDPAYWGIYDKVLLDNAVRRFARSSIVIEHPDDELTTADVLRSYQFVPQRKVMHMRWDVPR